MFRANIVASAAEIRSVLVPVSRRLEGLTSLALKNYFGGTSGLDDLVEGMKHVEGCDLLGINLSDD